MSIEYDEGFVPSPLQYYSRECVTFEADDETTLGSRRNESSKPHLSSWHNTLKESGNPTPMKFKPSPIKDECRSQAQNFGSYTGNNFHHSDDILDVSRKSRNHSTRQKVMDLTSLKKQFDGRLNRMFQMDNHTQSPTSDRASSVSSSGTLSSDNRSLNLEIKRAANLQKQKHFRVNEKEIRNRVFDESGFQLTNDTNYSDHSLPKHSQRFEIPRHASAKSVGTNVDLITRLADLSIEQADSARKEIQTRKVMKNTSMNTLEHYSDELLHLFNCHKQLSDEDRRIFQKNLDRDITNDRNRFGFVDILPPTYRSQETPILDSKSCASDSLISQGSEMQKEVVRHSESMHTLGFEYEKERDVHNLHQSVSAMNFNPPTAFYPLSLDHRNKSLPNLERFVVRPSTRDIFKPSFDIDEICAKGLKKNPKRAERIFGGSEAARTIHGPESVVTRSTKSLINAEVASTVSSRAKKREKSPTKLLQPPYCSAAQDIDGVSYSVNAVGQQLIGTLKSLYPDWLPLGHRIIKEENAKNVAILFRDELKRQSEAIENKFRNNRRNGTATPEEYDDITTKLNVIDRICDKLEYLMARGIHCSRVQQLKLIQSALLGA